MDKMRLRTKLLAYRLEKRVHRRSKTNKLAFLRSELIGTHKWSRPMCIKEIKLCSVMLMIGLLGKCSREEVGKLNKE